MNIFLIIVCIVIWSGMLIVRWRQAIYMWLDNKFDLERLRRVDKEKNNS
ncbi:MAG: hypothetical protein ABF876_12945 [Acetobacter aceti]|nr:hypothetical protein [Acetobacter aceti]